MFDDERVKEFREKAKRDYTEYQKQLYLDCDIACSLSKKDLTLFCT